MIEEKFLLPKDDLPKGVSSLYSKGEDYTTWFNSLSIKKWLKYSNINSVILEIEYSGSGELYILDNNKVIETITLNESGYIKLPINDIESKKILSIRLGKSLNLLKASWNLGHDGQLNLVKCCIVICTFNRHNFLLKTVSELSKSLPENWEVVIVDNSSTPEVSVIEDQRFTVVRNPNTGGSGGFTKGLTTALESDYTHVLFMDDDIEIDGRVLTKTNNFLKVVKPEYLDWFLSGGMLVLDEPTKLHELSARYDGIRVRHNHHNLNLEEFESIKRTQEIVEYKNHYGAWWYCVIPLRKDLDLPFPFFVNGDDIEFSLRHAPGILTLNGISVWHEAFHLKYNAIKQHYLTVRNSLFINLKHGINPVITMINFSARYFLQRVKGHKEEADLVLLGISDFLKGPTVLAERGNPFLIKNTPSSNWLKFFMCFFSFIFKYKKIYNEVNFFMLDKKLWDGINYDV